MAGTPTGPQASSGTTPGQTVEQTAARRKSIVLFSDGTGNSSAKLFKTNVWRMYEALDLGPTQGSNSRVQIAYYDNGVGTSNFRPLRVLGGIFGFGLKGGVLRLYRYLCRNYRPGDSIYAFGFSRGAFTIRLLVGLIASQGVLRCDDENDLTLQSRAAYRELCRGVWPNKRLARDFVADLRWLRDRLVRLKRKLLRQRRYKSVTKVHPDIQFVGVWDTVAAYGGPFAEVTRGVDDWIWPLTMPNYALSTKVVRAAHAVALDDERDAFMPLLWDEVRERDLQRVGEEVWVDGKKGPRRERRFAAPGRLNQVWFTGMHSDVGGGYPDESLSYVSLLWMMDQADAGVPAAERLRFLPHLVDRARNFANPYGPMHNSRAGLAAYYRYQPRKIAAWRLGADYRTKALRDPESVGRDKKLERCPDRGLLRHVRIHDSVIARIASGTDRYAPVSIPDRFRIERTATGGFSRPCISDETFDRFSDPSAQAERAEASESAWNAVWTRRKIYYLTVAVSLVLFFFPLLVGPNPIDDLCSDDRCLADRPIRWLDGFLPPFARHWSESFAEHPIAFAVLAVLLAILLRRGKVLAAEVHDRSWRLWNRVRSVEPSGEDLAPGWPAAARTHRWYQNSLAALRWQVLPLIVGWVLWLLILYAVTAAFTQFHLLFDEARARNCAAPAPAAGTGAVLMRTSDLCTRLGTTVTKGQRYLLTLKVEEEWKDGGPWARTRYSASPDSPPALPFYADIPGQPLRRVMSARWLEPVIRIRWKRPSIGHGTYIFRLGLKPVPGSPGCYGSEFEAKRDGALAAFVNDVRLPLDGGMFYRTNQGSAWIRVKPGIDDGTGKSYQCSRLD